MTNPTKTPAQPSRGCERHHLIHCSQCQQDDMVRALRAENDRLHTQVAALTAAPGVQANTKTHALLSTMIGLFLRAKEKIGYQPGSAIDKTVAEAIEHLKDWPYPEIAAPAQPAAPQGAAYVENPAEIEHVAGDVSKNRAESNMKGGAYAELPDARAMAERLMGWKLPADFAPDCYISFDRERATASGSWPIGTNLLTVAQAEAMFSYVLGQDPVGAIAGAFQTSLAHAADLKDAFAEVAHAVNRVDEAVYATLPAPNLPRGGFPDLFTADQMNAHADATHALRASHGQAPAVATLDVFGLQWPGEDRINLSTVFDTEAEALEYRDNRCDTPGILVVRLFAQPTHTAQPAPAATPQADSAQDEFTSREEWVERAMRVYLIAGDTEDVARECAEYQWGELDMDDIPDPYFTAMEDIEGRGPAPQAGSQPAPVVDREAVIRAAVAAMPHTNPMVADDLLGGFTMHTEADDIVAIYLAGRASQEETPSAGAVAESVLDEALPAGASALDAREVDDLVTRESAIKAIEYVALSHSMGLEAIDMLVAAAPPAGVGEPVFAFRRKGLDDFCTCTEERYEELSLKPNLFETRIFYATPPAQAADSVTAPAAGPSDSEDSDADR